MPKRTPAQPPHRVLQSVDRAAGVLEVLAEAPQGLALGDLAERLDLKPQTAQGLLRSLQAHELVAQPRRGGPYMLGPGVHELSRRWLEGCDRAALAQDVVVALADRLRESVLLAELRGDRLFGLVEVRGTQALTVSHNSLLAAPLHTMATGKLLLAFLAEEEQERLLASLDLRPHAPQTITDLEELREDLEGIRERGYAVSDEEGAEGVAALAVGVSGVADEMAAALGVAMPKVRFTPEWAWHVLDAMSEAAAAIAGVWGGPGTAMKDEG